MTSTDHLDSFLRQMQCQNTRMAYGKHLSCYLDTHKEKSLGDAFSRNCSVEHIARLRASEDSTSTKNQHLAALRSFGRYLIDLSLIPENGFADIRYFKSDSPTPESQSFLGLDQLRICVAFLDSQTGPLAERDSLMFKLIYSSGLKVSELIHLKINDVDLKNTSLRISTREIPIYPDLLDAFKAYLSGRRQLQSVECDFLFLSADGNQLSRCSVFRRIQRVGAEVGIPLSPSLLRNSFAAIAFGQGVALSELQGILGHKSLQTTSRIVGSGQSRVAARLHRRLHPRNRHKVS